MPLRLPMVRRFAFSLFFLDRLNEFVLIDSISLSLFLFFVFFHACVEAGQHSTFTFLPFFNKFNPKTGGYIVALSQLLFCFSLN